MTALFLYAPIVHAASSATITLSPTQGSGAIGSVFTQGTISVATQVTVKGSGFPANEGMPPSGFGSAIAIGYIELDKAVDSAHFHALTLIRPSLSDATGGLVADANGNFWAQFYVPGQALKAGTYNIVAKYIPNQGAETFSAVATFTVKAAFLLANEFTGDNTGIRNSIVEVEAVGFKGGEAISFVPGTLLTDGFGDTVGAFSSITLASGKSATCDTNPFNGRCSTGNTATGNIATFTDGSFTPAGFVSGLREGGDLNVVAFGESSGITASTDFVLNPSISLTSVAGTPLLSTTNDGASMYFTGNNFPLDKTIGADNMTLQVCSPTADTCTTAAVSTSQTTINTNAVTGKWGPILVTPDSNLNTGILSVKLNGTTYSWANGNIQVSGALANAEYEDLGGQGFQVPAGPILVSTPTGSAGTKLMADTKDYRALWDAPFVFGIGYTALGTLSNPALYTPTNNPATAIFALSGGSSGGAADDVGGFVTADGHGAFYGWQTDLAGIPAAYSSATLTVTDSASLSAQRSLTITPYAFCGGADGSVYSTCTGSRTPYVAFGEGGPSGATPFQLLRRSSNIPGTSCTLDGGRAGCQKGLVVTGFKETSANVPDTSFTITLVKANNPTQTWATVVTCVGTLATCNETPGVVGTSTTECGTPSGACYFVRLGPGDYQFFLPPFPDLCSGKWTVTVTGTTTGNVATKVVTVLPVVIGQALTNPSAAAVPSGNTGNTVALLSSSSVTSGYKGVHGLGFNAAYTLTWDGLTNVGTFTSTINGQIPPGTQFTVPAGTAGTHWVDIVDSSGNSAIYGSGYTGVVPRFGGTKQDQFGGYAINPTASAAPSGSGYVSLHGNTAQTDSGLEFTLFGLISVSPSSGPVGTKVTLSGSGLNPAKTYYAVLASGVTYATILPTSGGNLPTGVTFAWPATAASFGGTELGDNRVICVSSTGSFLSCDGGIGHFFLQSGATLSAAAGPAGSTVTLTASGLVSGDLYNIFFNYQLISQNGVTFTGAIIGGVLGGSDGSGTASITIPNATPAGTYVIQLVETPGESPGCASSNSINCVSLVNPPTFTVGGVTTGAGFTISGTPAQLSLGGTPFLSVTYTNGGTSAVTGIVILSVQNALGQTVYITTSTINPAGGQTATAYLDLGPLASGTYTANVFVLSVGGGSLSAPTTGIALHV